MGRFADELLNLARIDEADEVVAIPERPGITVDWPEWVDQDLLQTMRNRGVNQPWLHQ